jgi:predicted NBD/HSP70 family sugar kinase
VLAECVALVERVAARVPVVGIGVGICELVDPKGRAASAFTIDWLGFDVARAFRHEPWLYVSVGTGISYSLVVAGMPYSGARGNALVVGAPPVERVASGLALQGRAGVAHAQQLFRDGRFAEVVSDAATELGIALAARERRRSRADRHRRRARARARLS